MSVFSLSRVKREVQGGDLGFKRGNLVSPFLFFSSAQGLLVKLVSKLSNKVLELRVLSSEGSQVLISSSSCFTLLEFFLKLSVGSRDRVDSDIEVIKSSLVSSKRSN